MSTREGSYTVPATVASVERAARQIRQAFNDVFRYVPETERREPRRSIERYCRSILAGEQPAPVYWQRETQETPAYAKPDADKYAYRVHTVDVRVTGAYDWEPSDIPGRDPRRVLRIGWYMQSSYTYHAYVNGADVAGTLDEVWRAQCAPEAAAVNLADYHYPGGETFPAAQS